MADRHALIVVLLDSRHDHLPTPTRREPTDSGFVHVVDAHITCPDCFGEQPARTGCETCAGRGHLVEHRTRDPYAIDRVQPYGLDGAAGERERAYAATIGRLEAQLRAPWATELDALADANQHPYGWEAARRRMYARFDYRALDVAVELLHGAFPGVAARSPRGLAFIDPRMPDPIRAPRPRVVEAPAARGRMAGPSALATRDELVRALVAEGVGYGVIAQRVGLSARQLRRIINQSSAAA